MKKIAFALLFSLVAISAAAQALYFNSAVVEEVDSVPAFNPADTITVDPLPVQFFMPIVFDHYDFYDPAVITMPDTVSTAIFPAPGSQNPFDKVQVPDWLRRANNTARLANQLSYRLLYESPELVRYTRASLPDAPKMYHTVVDPSTLRFDIRQFEGDLIADAEIKAVNLRKRHWINSFSASLQFSQAYVSPNWYQGGNSNINGLANIYYNVKLNQAFHPNLLFESTMQYKLGINNAPEDKVHSYNISDDLLQLTSTFGVKAARRWYYSVSGMFKTQLLNSYKPNSNDVQSAFLSPGELNLGVGMTYNFTNTNKTISFDASISPLSYNLKTCTYWRVDPTAYEIAEGRKCRHKFGSSAELKFQWKISYNITYSTRMFAFTDYSDAYADWENTIVFDINRFLTTQIYAHLRYDSATQPCDDPQWHKLQIKEILSIGFAYKFNSI